MSKIKDLLAEEENIDDLKVPVHKYGKEFYNAVQLADCERIADSVYESSISKDAEDEIANRAQYEVDVDDEGHECLYLENYIDIIGDIVREHLDDMIEDQHLDLTDDEYFKIKDLAEAMLSDHYADYESQLCRDAEEDDKYKLDELRERNGRI